MEARKSRLFVFLSLAFLPLPFLLDPTHFILSTHLFFRLLGLIYFFALSPFLFQIFGLYGKEGILPIQNYLEYIRMRMKPSQRYYYFPTLFWINSSDHALINLVVTGVAFSVLLIFNVYTTFMLFALYVLFLSIKSTGRDFLSFGWDVFLLEITANAFFLSLTPIPNLWAWLSLNFLLFRFHVEGGSVKLESGDPSWRNLTALEYHYQTQPLPNAIAYFAHKLPLWLQKISAAMMFVVELIIPIGIFLSEETRLFAFFCFFFLQFSIWLTGNFSYLNHMTVVLCLILISDSYLTSLFPFFVTVENPIWGFDTIASIGGIGLLFLQIISFYHHYSPHSLLRKILEPFYPFYLANRYGIFAVMTTKRYEVVIEGSEDAVKWKEYLFYFKPSEVNRRPRRISPFHPRLDWQMWFLPFATYESEIWFQYFLKRLFEGSKTVLSLLRFNPFPEKPPRYLRALFYDYTFTDFKTLRQTGAWWNRDLLGNYTPTFERIKESESQEE